MDVARSIKCVVRKKRTNFPVKRFFKTECCIYLRSFRKNYSNIKRGCSNFGDNVLCCNTTPIPFLIERKTWEVR